MTCTYSLWVLTTLALTLTLSRPVGSRKTDIKRPVVIIPGDGGSQIFARLNKTSSPHVYCSKTSHRYSLWLNLEQLVVPAVYCFVDNMKLVYNNKTHTTHNTPGVYTTVPGFGDTSSIEYLDPSEIPPSWYFSSLVRSLVDWGYKRGVSVRGAPYDFRKAANEMGPYYKRLKALIEETFHLNKKRRVTLLGHSLGTLHTLYFLNQMSKVWKAKFVESFVAVAGPWGGSVKSLRAIASGDNLSIYKLPATAMRTSMRSMMSTYWMLPSSRFWESREPLVTTTRRNYTISDFRAFFRDMGYPEGYSKYLDTRGLLYNLTAPGVHVHCIHGYGINTPGQFIYPNGTWPDVQPEVVPVQGDGTVSMRSLVACRQWAGQQKQKVDYMRFEGSGHLSILNDLPFIRYIKSILFA